MKNIEKIMSIYDEFYNRTDGDGAVLSVLTLATVLEETKEAVHTQTNIIKIVCSNLKYINRTLDNIESYAADDLDGRLEDISKNIDGIKSMMFDTLGSAKTGDALDALMELPFILSHRNRPLIKQNENFCNSARNHERINLWTDATDEPDWMKED